MPAQFYLPHASLPETLDRSLEPTPLVCNCRFACVAVPRISFRQGRRVLPPQHFLGQTLRKPAGPDTSGTGYFRVPLQISGQQQTMAGQDTRAVSSQHSIFQSHNRVQRQPIRKLASTSRCTLTKSASNHHLQFGRNFESRHPFHDLQQRRRNRLDHSHSDSTLSDHCENVHSNLPVWLTCSGLSVSGRY